MATAPFYLTLFHPLKPGEGEWHREWTLCSFEETADAICGGDFADFKVSRVLKIDPVTGQCADVTKAIAEEVCDLTHKKEYAPDSYTRDFIEMNGFSHWYREAA